ncbi:phage holin family protein [Tatumella saanichensis]|uniref:phage holin family protein n=1 Tax=Tatumella saanichensis TaxID=480813 RepID=UPI0004A42016|nr:phage holin family protein [Tatumella saanichensis]
MEAHNWPALLNMLLSAVIVTVLMFWKREGHRYRPFVSLTAWVVVVVYGSIPIGYFSGHYTTTHWPVVMANLLICVAVCRAKGNIARLLDPLRL